MKFQRFTPFLTLVLLIFALPTLQAQVTVNGVSPFENYVSNLQGQGVTISNINIDCDTLVLPQTGGFDATASTLGLDSGLVISSGSINNPGGFGNSANGGTSPLLNTLGGATNFTDVCVVTFDFVPNCDTVRFNYVFASNEYPNFVNTQFNDMFGCFVSGPGITPNTNFALLTGLAIPPAINNVNNVVNTGLYLTNPIPGFDYFGRTVVLEAQIPVVPGQTYSVVLAVGDGSNGGFDDGYDTSVFIEAMNCDCLGTGQITMEVSNDNNINSTTTVENCTDGLVTFTNNGDTTQAVTFNMLFAGNAIFGTDYTFPTTITIPAGQSTLTVPMPIINDGIIEGIDTIIIEIDSLGCAPEELTIQDPFDAAAGPDKVLCSGDVSTIGLPALPGVLYDWDPQFGLQPPLNIAEPTVGLNTLAPLSYNYVLTAIDSINGCAAMDTVKVDYIPIPVANFNLDANACVDASTTITFTQIQVPGMIYNWNFDNPASVTGAGPGPYVVSWNTPGTKTVTLSVTNQNCTSTLVTKTIVVNPIPTSNFTVTNPICADQPAQILYTGSAGAGATFNWDFDGGMGGTGPGPFGVTWSIPGSKDITLTVEELGCVSPVFTQSVTVNQVPTADFSVPQSVCEGDLSQIAYTGNATNNAAYTWNFDGGQIISGVGGGPYVIQWLTPGVKTVCLQVEENGCISNLNCQTINILAQPNASIDPVADQCFSGNSFNFLYNGEANVNTYAWSFGADAVPATSTSPTPPAVNYLNPGIKTVSVVVTRNGCVSDTAQISFEVIQDPTADFTASTTTSCISECITYTYTGLAPGPQTTYTWDFGDGAVPATSSQLNPPCVDYTSGGTKTVSLIVNYRGCQDVMVQTITINPGPTVNAGADVDFCDGEGGAQINATVTGGTGTLYYNWWCEDPTGAACGLSSSVIEDPIANPLVTPFAPDSMTYYFQVTDVNGCVSNIDSVLVIVKPKPKMDAGPDVNICAEGPGAFLTGGLAPDNQAPLPISYQWSPSVGLNDANVPNPFARPDTTTIYTLQGISVNGCSSAVTTLDTLSTVTVTVDELPIAEAGRDTAICLLDSVQLQGSASASGPNYTYTWTPAIAGTIDDPNIPSPTVKPNFTTTYYLVVSSRGCDSRADSMTVMVDNQPTLSPGIDESVCQGDSVRLDGNATGDPGGNLYSYQWSPAVGLDDPTLAKPLAAPKQTTTYTLIATSENGACDSDPEQITVTVESTPVVFALSPDTIICEGSEIKLSADHGFKTPPSNPVSYAWTPNDASIQSSPFLPSVNVMPTSTTLYTVTASAPSGCATSAEILVTVNPEVVATVSADTSRFCEGTSTQLHVSGGLGNASFQWIPALGLDDPTSTDPIASPNVSTTYQVVVSEGVCVDTASLDITINPAPVVDYFASQANGCEGLEVSFMENSTNGVNYLWDFGDGSPVNNEANPTHVYPEPGQYPVSLTVVGAGGCEATLSKTIVEVSQSGSADFSSTPDFSENLALPNAEVQFTDLSTNGVSWYWDFGDGTISNQQNPLHRFKGEGEYSVSLSVTDQNGCVSFIQYGPYIVISPDLMIPNLLTPNDDGVNDVFRVQYAGNASFNLEIFDRWGRSFFSSDSPQDGWEGTDPQGGNAAAGVYFYSLKLGEKVYRGDISLMR